MVMPLRESTISFVRAVCVQRKNVNQPGMNVGTSAHIFALRMPSTHVTSSSPSV
jgi:hypothetical protein